MTDYDSGIILEMDVEALGAVFNRGPYREVRTITSEFMKAAPVYRVKEQVPEIIRQAHIEKEAKKKGAAGNDY